MASEAALLPLSLRPTLQPERLFRTTIRGDLARWCLRGPQDCAWPAPDSCPCSSRSVGCRVRVLSKHLASARLSLSSALGCSNEPKGNPWPHGASFSLGKQMACIRRQEGQSGETRQERSGARGAWGNFQGVFREHLVEATCLRPGSEEVREGAMWISRWRQ